MHFSRLAPLAILACSHLVLAQSAAATSSAVAAAASGSSATGSTSLPATSNTTTPISGSDTASGTLSDVTNTTSTDDTLSASTGSSDSSQIPTSVIPAPGNFASANGPEASSGTSGTSADSTASPSSAPSSPPSLGSSTGAHQDHDDYRHHDHGYKDGHPHHHPHMNHTDGYLRHKNRTGERVHWDHPIEEKIDVVHLQIREASPEPEPIWFGGGHGPVVMPEHSVGTGGPIFKSGLAPVVEREVEATEDRQVGNDTDDAENNALLPPGKGKPHHEHAEGHHKNGTDHHEHHGEHHKNGTDHHGHHGEHNGDHERRPGGTTTTPGSIPTILPEVEKEGARYNETEMPEHHKFNETGHGHPKHDGQRDQVVQNEPVDVAAASATA